MFPPALPFANQGIPFVSLRRAVGYNSMLVMCIANIFSGFVTDLFNYQSPIYQSFSFMVSSLNVKLIENLSIL